MIAECRVPKSQVIESWPKQLGIGSIRCSGHCDAAKLNFANPDEANEVHAGYAVKDSLKNGPASQRKPKERFKRCRDARAVLQQACGVEL